MSKICIFGAGSIGGYIATCLKKTSAEVSLVARGPHKKAIEENGLTLIKKNDEENHKFFVTDDVKKLDIHLIQFANLYRGKEKISMSTRKGEFVMLKTLIDEIGNDAINFFYLTKKKDQHLDFDLNLAISEDKNNPVYYIQYAHARIEKLLNEAGDYMNHDYNPDGFEDNLEKNLIDSMNTFGEICEKSITNLEPHLMTHYLQKLAQDFHSYYANVKLLTKKIDYSKIYLIAAVQKVLKCGLELLNINAPKQM